MTTAHRCLRLARYAPDQAPPHSCFQLDLEPTREPAAGEVLVEVQWLSMDPFPRLVMRGESSMAPQLPLGTVMLGRGVGRVLRSADPGFGAGDVVAGELGWRERACVPAQALRKVDPTLAPVELSLGLLGPSGLTAYFCVESIAPPQPGQTILVSAAAGSVGSTACRLAALRGARVVAAAWGQAQCRYLSEVLGADAVVDVGGPAPLAESLRAACPNGIDVFLDGVGGALHDAAMDNLNVAARVVVYGLISSYGESGRADIGPRHLMRIIQRRIHIDGFLVGDHAPRFAAALAQLADLYHEGRLLAPQHVSHGLEAVPAAFAALFEAALPGKQLVKL